MIPIPGYPGYLINEQGVVLGLRGRPLRHNIHHRSGHHSVMLYVDGTSRRRGVHQLVMEAFVGPPPEGLQVCHGDGDPDNNALENLRYDTPRANSLDAVRHGAHPGAQKTACVNGHLFDESNTRLTPGRHGRSARTCRACTRDNTRRYRLKQKDLR